MNVNLATGGNIKRHLFGAATACAISILIMAVASVLYAMIILSGKSRIENMGYGTLVVLLFSAFCGSMQIARNGNGGKLYICLLNGGVTAGAMLLAHMLFIKKGYNGVLETAAVIMAGSMLSILIPDNGKKQKKHRRQR